MVMNVFNKFVNFSDLKLENTVNRIILHMVQQPIDINW